MRILILACVLVLGSVAGQQETLRAGDMKLTDWALIAPIEITHEPGKTVADCRLTPEIVDASLPDLRDVRVLADGTEEIGYVVRMDHGSVHRLSLPVTLYNRTFVTDRESAVTVDFGTKLLKNRLRVITPGINFRRRVSLEGSDDGESWKTIRQNAWLFRIRHSGAKTTAYEGSMVTFPDNDFRYMKITVFNAEDDRGALNIEDVQAFQHIKTPAESVSIQVVSSTVLEKRRRTDLSLDLGYRHMPLHELKLVFSDQHFFRSVTVWGRNQETRVVRRLVEDSPALEKTVEEPWTNISQATIHRFSMEATEEEPVTVHLHGARYRYVQVRIENLDDQPLHFVSASASRLVQHLEFPTARGSRYALLTGNPKASPPVYDVTHYIGKLRAQGVEEARLGKLTSHPLHRSTERSVPWSERHKEILWIALLVMGMALGFLVYRMAVNARTQGSETASPD